jgi:tight adherence protein B
MPVPLSLELLAAVLGSGAPAQAALSELLRALDPEPAAALIRVAEPALALSARSGLPPAELLRAAAVRERSRQNAAARVAIRRLEVLLVLPAGLCLLPAFVLLGVAPVVIALFGG